MTDRESFLRAIAAEPDDDTARLVFADWLDEQNAAQIPCPTCAGLPLKGARCTFCGGEGTTDDYHSLRRCVYCSGKGYHERQCMTCQGAGAVSDNSDRERAKYIREAVDFARGVAEPRWVPEGGECWPCFCRRTGGQTTNGPCRCWARRGAQVLANCESQWRRVAPCVCCVRGDFTYEGLGAANCAHCGGAGDVGGLTGLRVPENTRDSRFTLPVTWERGFPAVVACQFADVWDVRTDAPTAWAKAVVTWHPVTRFEVTDKRPLSHHRGAYQWANSPPDKDADNIPSRAFACLTGYTHNDGAIALYSDARGANRALHTALATLARQAVHATDIG